MRAVIGYLVVAAVLVGGGLVLRSGSALEVAQVVRFLAGDGAAYITGQTLHVNGGLYM